MTIYDLCCGSGSFGLSLLGALPPAPYAGGKTRLLRQIHAHVEARLGAVPAPGQAVFLDRGEWARTLSALQQHGADVAAALRAWAPENDRGLFDRLRSYPPAQHPAVRAATHLYLQTRTYRAKPVYPTDTGWVTHGFDPEFRPNKNPGPNTHPRGLFLPRHALAERAEMTTRALQGEHKILQADVRNFTPSEPGLVYFDPNYTRSADLPMVDRNQVRYLHEVTRAEAVACVQRWRDAGSIVVYSQGERVDIPGFYAVQLRVPGQRTFALREEWLMISQ